MYSTNKARVARVEASRRPLTAGVTAFPIRFSLSLSRFLNRCRPAALRERIMTVVGPPFLSHKSRGYLMSIATHHDLVSPRIEARLRGAS